MVQNMKPDETEKLVEAVHASGPKQEEEEPEPPQPFMWDE